MFGGAIISDDGLYRYRLWRELRPGAPERIMTFIMLNPSIADASVDDPTIRRCMGFARREGCTRLDVVNLFAFRATKPSRLLEVGWPTGPENAIHIEGAIMVSHLVVAAWGAWWDNQSPNRRPLRTRVEDIAEHHGKTLYCLGETKKGAPRHPLYAPNTSPIVKWRAA